jgi:hypothetical protein
MENKKSVILKTFLFLLILAVFFVLIFKNKSKTEDVPTLEENFSEIDMSLGEENGEALPQ